MTNTKIWKVRGLKDKFTDEELVQMISNAYLKGDDYISSADMKSWLKIKDSIYQFYLNGGNNNETI